MTEFEVGVKRTIVTIHVKVPMQLESLELELLSGSYEFLNETATNQIWITAAD